MDFECYINGDTRTKPVSHLLTGGGGEDAV